MDQSSNTPQTRNPQPNATVNLQPNGGSLQPGRQTNSVFNNSSLSQENIPISSSRALKVESNGQPISSSVVNNLTSGPGPGLYLLLIAGLLIGMLIGLYKSKRLNFSLGRKYNKHNNFAKLKSGKKQSAKKK